MIRTAIGRSLQGISRLARPCQATAMRSLHNTSFRPSLLKKQPFLQYKQTIQSRFMTSTSTSAEAASAAAIASKQVSKPAVAYWLYFNAGMVFAIVVVGGLTRLTESGLSITEWNVISGMKPPRSEAEWIEEFEKYKQYPEYKL
jgi:cytochrome c oxidase assembly protein subunit 15